MAVQKTMPEQVADWLERLGLGEYGGVFEENAIDAEVLPELTDSDLRSMGVKLGHRKKLLKAIADFDSPDDGSAGLSPSRTVPPVTGVAERRRLTVMFCDLAGSTELSQRLDPEDLREINRAYQGACKAAIEHYDGYVAKYMGDGVLAYFGYPQAHEDSAERAIHAGLRLIQTVGSLEPGRNDIELSVRVGIETGPVVVGDIIGEGASQENAVVGETPNLAARLEEIAALDTVVIGPGTRGLAGERFEYQELGSRALKGIAEPVDTWRVLSPVAVESRFATRRHAALSPLVGRDNEIGLLLERWKQAKEGEGQVVLLSGEAGIGKSRIIEAFLEKIASERFARIRYQCSPTYSSTALHPVITHIQRQAKIDFRDPPDRKLDKLETLLWKNPVSSDMTIQLFASLLSIPTAERYPLLDMAPEQQKEKIMETLSATMEGLIRHVPVVVIAEDTQWADSTTLELLERTIEQAQRRPAMYVLSCRPEFFSVWNNYAYHTHRTSLSLNRFTQNLVSEIVDGVAGGKPLPPEVLERIIEKTDGVPLFAEELTRTVLESGAVVEEPDRYRLAGVLREFEFPNTLHDALMARLDRLGLAKEVAQTAAAIGREWEFDLLETISLLSSRVLGDAAKQLVDVGLIYSRGPSEEGRYKFKHALVHDAAYSSMLKSERRKMHTRIASALQEKFPERIEQEPELLAHHLTEAQMNEVAVEQWKKAGLRAMDIAANSEGVAHLRRALELFHNFKDAGRRPEVELSIMSPLASALWNVVGWADRETQNTYVRLRELCRRVDDISLTFPVAYASSNSMLVHGQYRDGLELALQCLDLADADGERTRVMAAHSMIGQIHLCMGDFDASRKHIEAAIDLHDPEQDSTLGREYGEDPGVMALVWRSLLEWTQGFPTQATSTAEEALSVAQQWTDMQSSAAALTITAWVHLLRGEIEPARETAQRCLDFCAERSIPSQEPFAAVIMGSALSKGGCLEQGTELMSSVASGFEAAELGIFFPWMLTCMAEGHKACGKLDAGVQTLAKALDEGQRSGDEFWLAEIHRLRGECLLSLSAENAPEAEDCFRDAIGVAKEQGGKSLELRAVTGLALLLEGQGRRDEARSVLSPVYNWFTEGFDTIDMTNAKTLLNQLR